jgi:hypothetical protein
MKTIIRYGENEASVGEGQLPAFDSSEPALIPKINDTFRLYPSVKGWGRVTIVEE